jgi:hypothetical protein
MERWDINHNTGSSSALYGDLFNGIREKDGIPIKDGFKLGDEAPPLQEEGYNNKCIPGPVGSLPRRGRGAGGQNYAVNSHASATKQYIEKLKGGNRKLTDDPLVVSGLSSPPELCFLKVC